MIVEQVRVGGDRNFGYLLGCEKQGVAALIDPSYSPSDMVALARDRSLKVTHIINTHGDHDHINGNDDARAATKAPVVAHPDCPVNPDIPVGDGDTLKLGSLTLTFRYVPGHSDDSVMIVVDNAVAFTGDILFVGKVGGTATDNDAKVEFESLHNVVLKLPDDVVVYPGHDFGVNPHSTIGIERATNPFLTQPDLAAFLHLKQNWATYKRENGIA